MEIQQNGKNHTQDIFDSYQYSVLFWESLNPFTPMSDQDWISPYNISTISSR